MRISVSILVFLVLVCFSFAATLVVNQTAPSCTSGSAYYADLTTAVAASSSGDTIYVCDGTYTEASISTTNSLNLYGYDYAGAILSSTAASTSYALYLYGANTNVTNITVTSPGGGILVANATNCALNSMNVTSTSASTSVAAISLSNATSCSITSVYTNASAHAYSISLLAGSNNSIINRSTAMANGSSVYIYESGSISVLDSTIHSNTASASLYIRSSSNDLINNVTSYCGGNAAIYMYESTNNNVSNSSFTTINFYAVFLSSDAGNNRFYNNFFNGSTSGSYAYVAPGLSNTWNTTQQTGTRIYGAGTQIGGNYWTNSSGTGYSDTCTDANSDGICDSAYTIGASNIDNLPLAAAQVTLPLVVNSSSSACTSGSAYYSTIQAAINAASAGNTIRVCKDGTYTENVIVNKSVNIYGNESGVVVNASSANTAVFTITSSNVNISNLTIKDANLSGAYGVYATGNSVSIKDCIISNDYRGIRLDSTGNTVSRVNVSGVSYGVYLYASGSNNISDINISVSQASDYALFLASGSNNNNISNVNATAIGSSTVAVSQSSNNLFSNVNATSTSWAACSVWYNSNSNTFLNSRFNSTGYYAFYIQGDSVGTNLSNVVLDGGFYSIPSVITQCNTTFTNVTSETGKQILYYGNQQGVTLNGNDTAQIFFCNVSNSSISNTNVTIQRADAMDIWYGSGNNLSGVISTTNKLFSVYLYSTSNNNLTNVNASSNSSYALYLYTAENDSFSNINATNLAGTAGGAYLITSSGNTFLNSRIGGGLRVSVSSQSQCNNTLTNVTSRRGKQILYYANQQGVTLDGNDTAQIFFCNVSNSSISNTNATSDGGGGESISVRFGSGNNISNVNATNDNSAGIYLYSTSGNRISQSTATTADDSALYLESCSNTSISYDNATSDYSPAYVSDSTNTNISNCVLTANVGYTIYLDSSSNDNMTNNTLYSGYTGCEYNDDCYEALYADSGSGNIFLWNTIYADYWITSYESDIILNDSTSGNKYYLYNGTSASTLCTITTSTYSWADGGSDRPFNSTLSCLDTSCGSRWPGEYGQDWHPWVGGTAPETTPSPGPASSTTHKKWLSLKKESFNCSSGELEVIATASSSPVSNLRLRLSSVLSSDLFDERTDSDGKAVFTITRTGNYKLYSEGTSTYFSIELDPFDLTLCPETAQSTAQPTAAEEANNSSSQNTASTTSSTSSETAQNTQPAQPAGQNQAPSQQSITVASSDAQTAITAANSAITSASKAGKDTSAAQAKLNAATAAFSSKDYARAKELSDQAKQLALTAPPAQPPPSSKVTKQNPPSAPAATSMGGSDWNLAMIFAGVAIVTIVGAGVYFILARRRGAEKNRKRF